MLFRDVSGPDRGEKFFFAEDPDTKEPAYFWIRRMPLEVEESFKKKYLKSTKNRQTGRREHYFDETKDVQFALDKAIWCWTDAEGLIVQAEDDEAAAFYREALSDQQVETGKALKLDGRLSPEIKRRLSNKFPVIPNFVLEKVVEMNERSEAYRVDRTENL